MDVVDGNDLLLYVDQGSQPETPQWVAVANATSHQITTNSETKERVTKDVAGKWKGKQVTGLSTSIKCDALVGKEGYGYWDLLKIQKQGKPVKLKYGLREGLEQEGDEYEEGLFIITTLERNDPAKEDSTMSATFENTGEVATKTAAPAA